MLYTQLLLAMGIPAIIALAVLAIVRARRLAVHIREVKEDMARNPQNPYAALAELMAEREGRKQDG